MKIQIMSDLHLEFHRDEGADFVASLPNTGADVLVLAGDIGTVKDGVLKRGLQWFCKRWPLVVFVPGNHEYYGMHVTQAQEELAELYAEIPNLLPANGIDKIWGGTLWFRASEAPRHLMRDFRCIKGFEPWVYAEAAMTRLYLEENVEPGDIVVTHHMPSMQSVPTQYLTSALNDFFVTDMMDFIEERKPALWIHGHTHTPCDYRIGPTRVVCNPLGYPGEHAAFRDNFIVEV